MVCNNLRPVHICANIPIYFVEIVRALIQFGNSPRLEFVSHCIIISPDTPEAAFNPFEDAAEEEAFNHQCMLLTLTKSHII